MSFWKVAAGWKPVNLDIRVLPYAAAAEEDVCPRRAGPHPRPELRSEGARAGGDGSREGRVKRIDERRALGGPCGTVTESGALEDYLRRRSEALWRRRRRQRLRADYYMSTPGSERQKALVPVLDGLRPLLSPDPSAAGLLVHTRLSSPTPT